MDALHVGLIARRRGNKPALYERYWAKRKIGLLSGDLLREPAQPARDRLASGSARRYQPAI
jgi:hypothetical protein